jgi:cell division protein FtsB
MKKGTKQLLKLGLASTLLVTSTAGWGTEKPKTVEDLWKIIQAQQKEIDELKAERKTEGKTAASAESETKSAAKEKDDIKEVSRKTDILSQEVEKLRTQLVIPEEPELRSAYGMGPAASKVYHIDKGLSIGGYGEGRYQAFVGDANGRKDNADLLRFVLYTGYKFTDNILFNSELEFEHASTGKTGSVSLEFAALDFLLDPMVNIRAGLVLMPMGFINTLHEPPFFFGNNRPEVELRIIPTTWRENGAGLLGELLPGLTYTAYAVNGMDARGFTSEGIRGGRQAGSRALAEDWASVTRVTYVPPSMPELLFESSMYLGDSGQGQTFAVPVGDQISFQKVAAFTQLYEAHMQWKYKGWKFRALGAWGHIGNAGTLSAAKGQTIGSSNYGWYTEIGYNVLPVLFPETSQYLAPFFRFEKYDTIATAPAGFPDIENLDRQIIQFGLQYKPTPNVVIKADYRNFTAKRGSVPDDFNLGFGFIF